MSRRALLSLSLGLLLALAGLGPFAGLARPAQAQSAGTAYTSPGYGYTLTYDASWTVPTKAPAHGADTLLLTNGVSAVAVTAGQGFDGNAQDCLANLRQQGAKEAGVGNPQPLTGGSGQPRQGASATSAWAVSTFTLKQATASLALAERIECQTLAVAPLAAAPPVAAAPTPTSMAIWCRARSRRRLCPPARPRAATTAPTALASTARGPAPITAGWPNGSSRAATAVRPACSVRAKERG